MDRDPICSISMGFKNSVLVSHRIQFMIPNVQEFLMSWKFEISENFNFPTAAENVQEYDSHQPATYRNEWDRERSIMIIIIIKQYKSAVTNLSHFSLCNPISLFAI